MVRRVRAGSWPGSEPKDARKSRNNKRQEEIRSLSQDAEAGFLRVHSLQRLEQSFFTAWHLSRRPEAKSSRHEEMLREKRIVRCRPVCKAVLRASLNQLIHPHVLAARLLSDATRSLSPYARRGAGFRCTCLMPERGAPGTIPIAQRHLGTVTSSVHSFVTSHARPACPPVAWLIHGYMMVHAHVRTPAHPRERGAHGAGIHEGKAAQGLRLQRLHGLLQSGLFKSRAHGCYWLVVCSASLSEWNLKRSRQLGLRV